MWEENGALKLARRGAARPRINGDGGPLGMAARLAVHGPE